MDSFLRLTAAQSAEAVVAATTADPRLLDPAFEAHLLDVEQDLRTQGTDADLVSAWRLVLQSIRGGRNLYASAYAMLDARSERAVRDLALAEPLLLDPVIDTLLAPFVRALQQQGKANLADEMQARRELLAKYRAHGAVDGYFDVLISQIVRANSSDQARLKADNADLAEDFRRYIREQLKVAANLGHHHRMQSLLLASAVMSADNVSNHTNPPETEARVSELIGLFLSDVGFGEIQGALTARPELLTQPAPFIAAGLLESELDRAALERDIIRVRELWVRRALLLRCAEAGASEAVAELIRGDLWPGPDERI